MKSPKILLPICLTIFIFGCEKNDRSFSILGDSQAFQQGSSSVVQKKIDILWVVDDSGSMAPFQQKLVTNFNSFISNFISKGYDFHIGVTTTSAYLSLPQFNNNASLAKLRDGTGNVHTGFPIIDIHTPNPIQTFTTNASQGDQGEGDERAFSSLKAALQNSNNTSFLRPGSFLAVIILSDEDDFSDPTRSVESWLHGGIADHSYANPHLETVDSYISFLDQITNSTDPNARNYNVSTVSVIDNNCLTAHRQQTSATIMGTRYMDLATKTNGVLADICAADYASSLLQIQSKIFELSTQFFLNRAPVPESIVVHVDGVSVNQDPTNGWTYDATTVSIIFHGTAVPAQGSSIIVDFDPAAPKN